MVLTSARLLSLIFSTVLVLSTMTNVHAQSDATLFMLGVNSLDSTLSVYRVTSQGVVRSQSFYPTAKNPKAVVIHPSGNFAYVVAKTANTVMAYDIGFVGSRLVLNNPRHYPTNTLSAFALAIHPSGRYLYVAAREGKITAFQIQSKTGDLIEVSSSPYDSQARTRALIVHSSGKFLYAVNAYANSISAYRIDNDTGILTALPGSPVSVLPGNTELRSLWPLADVPPGAGGIPYFVAQDPQGQFLYVSNWGAGLIAGFTVDQNSGALLPMRGSPFEVGLNPYAVAVHPGGRFLYATSWQTDSLWAYRIDSQSGSLTALPQKSFASGGKSPVSIAFNGAGTMAYVANSESAGVSSLKVDPDSGEVSLLQTTQTRPGPWWLTQPLEMETEVHDKHLYSFDTKTNRLSVWQSNGKNQGELVDSIPLPSGELWTVQKQTGAIYAADQNRKSIVLYKLENGERRLVRVEEQPLPGVAVDLAIDANGWYLYALTKEPATLVAYGINAETSRLMPMAQPVGLSFNPGGLLLDPAGRFAYALSVDFKQLSVFSYRQNTGPLLYERTRFGSPYALSGDFSNAVVDPGGNFLMFTHTDGPAVAIHQVEAMSGALRETAGSPIALNATLSLLDMPERGDVVTVFDDRAKKLLLFSRDPLTGAIVNAPMAEVGMSNRAISAMAIDGDLIYLADRQAGHLLVYALQREPWRLSLVETITLPAAVDKLLVIPTSR